MLGANTEELGWIKEDVEKARLAFKAMKGRDIDVAVEIVT